MKCQKGAVASQARSIGAQCHQLTSPLVAMQLINQVARELSLHSPAKGLSLPATRRERAAVAATPL